MIAVLAKTFRIAAQELGSLDLVKFRATEGRGQIKTEAGIEDFRIFTRPDQLRGFQCDRWVELGPPVSSELIRAAEMRRTT